MRKLFYALMATSMVCCLFISCDGKTSTIKKTISDYLQTSDGVKLDLNIKILDLKQQGTITVGDSIAWITKEFGEDSELEIAAYEEGLAGLEATRATVLEDSALLAFVDEKITEVKESLTSAKNLKDSYLDKYKDRDANEVLVLIERCKYSGKMFGMTAEATADFYISPDGTQCYGRKNVE